MSLEEKDTEGWQELQDKASNIAASLRKEGNDLENVMMLRLAAQMIDDKRRKDINKTHGNRPNKGKNS